MGGPVQWRIDRTTSDFRHDESPVLQLPYAAESATQKNYVASRYKETIEFLFGRYRGVRVFAQRRDFALSREATMSAENKETIRRIREEAGANLDMLDGLFTDDYVYHGPSVPGELRGANAFKEMLSGFTQAMPDAREKVEDQLADGDKVFTRFSGRGAHTGELMGMGASGKELTWTGMVVSRFSEGLIAEEWVEWDSLSFLQQLGVVPPLT